jgi:hypothetical protein
MGHSKKVLDFLSTLDYRAPKGPHFDKESRLESVGGSNPPNSTAKVIYLSLMLIRS